MQTLKAIGCALFAVGVGWLAVMLAFVLSGLHSGKVQDLSAAILGIGVFGLLPALLLWAVGAVLVWKARLEARAQAPLRLEEALLERVGTRGRLRFDDLAQELGVTPGQVEAAVYAVTGKRLFTGYVDWRGREIISREAEQLAGDRCPNCGGTVELAGKGMARCEHCGTETYLPQPPA